MNWTVLIVFIFAGGIRYLSTYLLKYSSSSSPSSEKSQLLEQIFKLKQEAEELNTPSTFAKHSKCLRQIVQLQKKLAEFPESSVVNNVKNSVILAVKVM